MKVKDMIDILSKVDGDMDIRFSLGGNQFYRIACAELALKEYEDSRNDSLGDMIFDKISIEENNRYMTLELGIINYPYHELLERQFKLIQKECC